MAAKRRLGQRNSKTRAAIIEAAEKILLEEGGTALTSRRIAEEAGIRSQLIHYYFRTMEDLIVTLMQRAGDAVLRDLGRAGISDNPIRGLWEVALESTSSAVVAALLVLAADHERVRAEAIRYAEQGREIQTEAIARHLKALGLEPPIPPVAIAFLISAAARQTVQERAHGTSLGHREAVTAIESWLLQFTVRPPSAKRSSNPTKGLRTLRTE